MPNKLSQFWQELKRRKVIRVITVYAAAAFVILELVDIIAPNLGLPVWTFNLVLILLCVGFIISVIVSWIYDVKPEGGIVKTEPVHKGKEADKPATSKSWKIASYFSFVVIIGLIVLNIIPRTGNKEILDKSIAVLPFRNDSPEQEMYFINGTMEEILDNLCKIKDLRVISRNSVEQYRDQSKPTPEIAEEMNVSYVLEGSGQREGNNIRLTVQLLDARNDHHVWSESYYRKIENIFSLQSEIAQLVAEEIKAVITPQEKQLIEKIPTSDLTAYDFYQQGRDEHWKYWLKDDKEALDRAENRYHKALEFDSTFAQAYTGLADVYSDRYYWKEYFTEEFLDSFLILTNIALSYDDQLAEAYRYRGDYYERKGNNEQALIEYNQALHFNPNDWRAYRDIGYLYSEEPIKKIEYLEKALSLNHGSHMSFSLQNLGRAYLDLGFTEKGMQNYEEALAMDGDSMSYLLGLAFAEFGLEHFDKVLEITRRIHKEDSMWMPPPLIYNLTGNHQEVISIYEKTRKYGSYSGWVPIESIHRIGVALWKVGEYDKATDYFNQHIQYALESIELGRAFATSGAAYNDLAGDYAWLGEKEKAIQYLKELNKKQFFPLWWVIQIKVDPLYEPIRDEPEYKRIVREAEAKHQAEHERVRQWLDENDR